MHDKDRNDEEVRDFAHFFQGVFTSAGIVVIAILLIILTILTSGCYSQPELVPLPPPERGEPADPPWGEDVFCRRYPDHPLCETTDESI